jgi:hypothetical protein
MDAALLNKIFVSAAGSALAIARAIAAARVTTLRVARARLSKIFVSGACGLSRLQEQPLPPTRRRLRRRAGFHKITWGCHNTAKVGPHLSSRERDARRLVMRMYRVAEEPTLDELLDDDVMRPVMKSAGLDAGGLRALLRDLAERLSPERFTQRCGCSPEPELQPAAG